VKYIILSISSLLVMNVLISSLTPAGQVRVYSCIDGLVVAPPGDVRTGEGEAAIVWLLPAGPEGLAVGIDSPWQPRSRELCSAGIDAGCVTGGAGAAWDGSACNDPDRPGCATCVDGVEVWRVEPGEKLILDGGLRSLRVVVPANGDRVSIAAWGGCTDIDLDGDAGTDADIEAFFTALRGDGWIRSADFDHDGDTGTDADIAAFYRVLGGG
jgi:hypothetical protein